MKLLVVYYSMYGRICKMAEAAAEGARSVAGVTAELRRVPETLPREVLEKMGAVQTLQQQSHIPVCTVEELGSADAVIFATPTRFGNMCDQMRQFLDATGKLWMSGALVGKAGSVIASFNTSDQEATILSFHTTLLHQGMVVVGMPYTFKSQMIGEEISGCSPYGASAIAGPDGSLSPSDNELAGARSQGAHVAEIAKKLCA